MLICIHSQLCTIIYVVGNAYYGDPVSLGLPYDEINPEVLIEQKIILPEEVDEILVNLEISKSTGPDGINNKLLREAAVLISKHLCHFLNYSLSTARVLLWSLENYSHYTHPQKNLICFAIIIGQFCYYAAYQRFLKNYCSNTYIIS